MKLGSAKSETWSARGRRNLNHSHFGGSNGEVFADAPESQLALRHPSLYPGQVVPERAIESQSNAFALGAIKLEVSLESFEVPFVGLAFA